MIIELKPLRKHAWSNVYKYAKCNDDLAPYWTRSGSIYTGLTERDQKRLGELLRQDLHPTSDFWKKFYVRVGARTLYLDTKDPMDELKYLFLKNHKKVKTSYAEHKASAEYILLNKEEEARRENVYNKIKRRAIKEFDNLSLEDMRKVLRLYGYNVDTLGNEEVEKMLFNSVEEDPERFLKMWVDNKDRETTFLIQDAISKNIIRRNKNIYRYGSEIIGHNLDETIAFLDDPKNNDIRRVIISQINAKKEVFKAPVLEPKDMVQNIVSKVKKEEAEASEGDEAMDAFNEMMMEEGMVADDSDTPVKTSKKKKKSKS